MSGTSAAAVYFAACTRNSVVDVMRLAIVHSTKCTHAHDDARALCKYLVGGTVNQAHFRVYYNIAYHTVSTCTTYTIYICNARIPFRKWVAVATSNSQIINIVRGGAGGTHGINGREMARLECCMFMRPCARHAIVAFCCHVRTNGRAHKCARMECGWMHFQENTNASALRRLVEKFHVKHELSIAVNIYFVASPNVAVKWKLILKKILLGVYDKSRIILYNGFVFTKPVRYPLHSSGCLLI